MPTPTNIWMIRPPEIRRQSHPFPGHHVSAQTRAARSGGQCPKPRAFAVGASRRGIDGREHGAILIHVMAGFTCGHADRTRRGRAVRSVAGTSR